MKAREMRKQEVCLRIPDISVATTDTGSETEVIFSANKNKVNNNNSSLKSKNKNSEIGNNIDNFIINKSNEKDDVSAHNICSVVLNNNNSNIVTTNLNATQNVQTSKTSQKLKKSKYDYLNTDITPSINCNQNSSANSNIINTNKNSSVFMENTLKPYVSSNEFLSCECDNDETNESKKVKHNKLLSRQREKSPIYLETKKDDKPFINISPSNEELATNISNLKLTDSTNKKKSPVSIRIHNSSVQPPNLTVKKNISLGCRAINNSVEENGSQINGVLPVSNSDNTSSVNKISIVTTEPYPKYTPTVEKAIKKYENSQPKKECIVM